MPPATAISPDEIQDCLRQYATQKRVCESENGVLRNIIKRGKSAGINVRAMLATHKARKLDPDEVVAELRDQIHYMSLSRIPITSADLFAGWGDVAVTERSRMADDIWTAEDTGYRAGRYSADVAECPYDAGSELQVAWMKFYHQGQAAIAREMGPDATQASTSRKRPAGRGEQATMPEEASRMRVPGAKSNGARKKQAGAKKRGRPPGSGRETAQRQLAGPAAEERAAAVN